MAYWCVYLLSIPRPSYSEALVPFRMRIVSAPFRPASLYNVSRYCTAFGPVLLARTSLTPFLLSWVAYLSPPPAAWCEQRIRLPFSGLFSPTFRWLPSLPVLFWFSSCRPCVALPGRGLVRSTITGGCLSLPCSGRKRSLLWHRLSLDANNGLHPFLLIFCG